MNEIIFVYLLPPDENVQHHPEQGLLNVISDLHHRYGEIEVQNLQRWNQENGLCLQKKTVIEHHIDETNETVVDLRMVRAMDHQFRVDVTTNHGRRCHPRGN
jgi:hypothetical protein